jgi:apolipoprotein N-acyltransferase
MSTPKNMSRKDPVGGAPSSSVAKAQSKNSGLSGYLQTLFTTQVWKPAAMGAACYWAALPPWNLVPLAWVAVIFFVSIIVRKELPGKRPYFKLYLVWVFFCLATFHWLRLPHPMLHIGWLAGATYLGYQLPTFIGLARVAVHRMKIPVVVAAPVVWIALEYARAYLFTGFTMGALSHSQVEFLPLIQIADLGGQYLVDGLIMLVGVGFVALFALKGKERARTVTTAVLLFGLSIGYGVSRMSDGPSDDAPSVKIALIQGSIDTHVVPEEGSFQKTWSQYAGLSAEAATQNSDLDLVVWPESMWPDPVFESEPNLPPPPDWDGTTEEFEAKKAEMIAKYKGTMSQFARSLDASVLLGAGVNNETADGWEHYNSALHVSREGEFLGRYDKMHLVMFGEYVPIVGHYPELNPFRSLCPQVQWGVWPTTLDVGDLSASPNICYESVIPHLIRSHVVMLRQEGREPDILLNMTNDGWFRGSSELDMHLACGIFRAVETRKPFLIAANTGVSAWIDGDGRVIERGPRQDVCVIIAEPHQDPRSSPYLLWGDLPAGACLFATFIFAFVGWRGRRKERKPSQRQEP